MAKKKSTRQPVEEGDPYGLNEVDEFASKREKVLLEEAGLNVREQTNDEDDLIVDEDEEEVLAMSDDSSEQEEEEEEEEEELDGETAYKKVFGRKLDLGEDPEEDQDAMLDNENAWGSSKNEYYGADDLDDEQTAREIEKEALRQQKKHLEDLNMDDYLDDEVETEWVKEAKEFDLGQFQESTSQKQSNVSVKDVLNMDSEARESFLRTSFPEFFPLSRELQKLAPELEALKSNEPNEVNNIKVMALSSYLGTISSYFAIFQHEIQNNDEFSTMKEHPVMESILTSKEVWRQAGELPEDSILADEEQQSEEDEQISDVGELDEELLDRIEDDDIQQEELEEESNDDENSLDGEDEADELSIDVTKARISKREQAKTENLGEDIDDFVESEMADVDAQEKKSRKKTLRFYTSKIDQQEKKKSERFKGDDDIPYKERLFERQQRLLEEARKRGLHDSNGADLDDKEYNSEDENVAKSINKESEDGYYAQVQQEKATKKHSRMQSHKDALKAAKEGKLAELAEEIGSDGKRAINYQILKNKGLTPKRKKDNRNSRVKKRKKYEKAQKKLKSVRAVYSGGQSGSYEGEKTGIKKNLTRSVKFKG